jgi:glucose-6-phosphate isomerase
MEAKIKSKKQKAEKRRPKIRFLYDMKNVIYDREWLRKASNLRVYYMYREIKEMEGLRYDITVIPPKMFGKEFAKTKGNCNSNGLQELYTVLRGKAIFLMQKMKGRVVKDVMAVKAKKGDWVIVPPEYYVISINPTKNILKLGNWVSQKNKNIYKDLEVMNGACYYYTRLGWIKNKNYKKTPKLRFKKPLRRMPENLDFMKG